MYMDVFKKKAILLSEAEMVINLYFILFFFYFFCYYVWDVIILENFYKFQPFFL